MSFEGETQDEIVHKVRRWLLSVEGAPEHRGAVDVVERASELTKDVLTLIAAAAPEPVAHSEVVRRLTRMGYVATDDTTRAVLGALDAVAELSGDSLVTRMEDAGRTVAYEMGTAVARRVLRAIKR